MKRPLALFCGTFIVVSLICSLIQIKEAATLCLSLFAVLLIAGLIRSKKSKRLLVISTAVGIAFTVFYTGYTLHYKKAISYSDAKMHDFHVSVLDDETAMVSKIDGERVYPLNMSVDFEEQVSVGERLIMTGKVKTVGSMYDLSNNIYLKLSLYESARTEKTDVLISAAHYLRTVIKNRFTSVLDDDTAAKIIGILLGDKSGITIAEKNKYSASGISHIFSVSGLHLTAIVGLLVIFLRLFYVRRKTLAFVLSGAVLFFMWLVGFTPSVQRAGIMIIVLCLSYLSDRRADSLTSLCLAGAIICCSGPYAAADCGFLLSFLAVLSLITISKYFNTFFIRCFEKVKLRNVFTEKISRILGASVSVMLFTLPVIVICFRDATILSPLTNLFVLWTVAPILFLSAVLVILPIKPVAVLLTLIIGYIDKIVSVLLKYNVCGNLFTQKITLMLYITIMILVVMCLFTGKEFVNKAIFAFFIIVGVTAISSYAVNRFDGLTVIQTKTYNGNCVLLIEDKKAMSIIEGDFSTAPENAVYGICNSLADYGIYQLEKVVIHSDDKKIIEMLGSNIEVGEWYVNEKCEIEFCENAILTDYLRTRVNRGESSFLIMGKYDNKNTYEDADADILIFANKCPDVDFMIDRNIKLAISGRIKETITDRKYMNFLERFFQNNIYTVEECGTIEVRTTGNGEYDIKTERNNYAHK